MGSLTVHSEIMNDLHPQLAKDTIIIGRFDLCILLLMNDANYPWFILVPDRKHIKEIFQLEKSDQQTLLAESCLLSEVLAKEFSADKLNVAALGNVVPQLHLHHIVRYINDPAWPAPVWGKLPAITYSKQAVIDLKEKMVRILNSKLADIK